MESQSLLGGDEEKAEAYIKQEEKVAKVMSRPLFFHNLVAGMSWFQTAFTVRTNRQTNQCDHVFAGRYKSGLVQTSAGKQRAPEKAEHYLKQAQKTWKLTKKKILLKRKSPTG